MLLGTAWILTICASLRPLLSYENAPGRSGTIPSAWPRNSKIALAPDQDTLVMFAHPHCPCTRASISELAESMAEIRNKITAYVVFLKPSNSTSDWEDTSLRRSAAKIPGVTVISDVDGTEADKFGAETSGHAFLFDSSGRLLFNGGITGSRGHEGDNAGKSAIVSLINQQSAARSDTFVFGCSLFNAKQHGKEKQKCPR